MAISFGRTSAYEHNGDRALMESLGLRTTDFGHDWTDLGTVVIQVAKEQTYGNPQETQVCPATTIKVEVIAMPAQFWRFTITRPQDKTEDYGKDEHNRDLWRAIYEPVERFEIATGSGGFSTYWPIAKAVAEHMVDIERKTMTRQAGNDHSDELTLLDHSGGWQPDDGLGLARIMARERDERFEQLKAAEAERDQLRASLREVYDYMCEVEGAHAGCCAVRSYLSLPRTEEERMAIGERARALLAPPKPLVGADDEHTPRGQRS